MDEGRIRKIIHIDMDAFYASVEQRDEPALRGKPVAVGYPAKRGVVAAASYEARSFGVRSAMPSTVAIRKCAELVFVPPRFDVYREVSKQIHAILKNYTPLVEPLSLDEAYLDVTDNLKGIPTAWETAKEIRARIYDETKLTASAGISCSKFLAKLASDYRKPNGQFAIMPDQAEAFVAALPVLGKERSLPAGWANRKFTPSRPSGPPRRRRVRTSYPLRAPYPRRRGPSILRSRPQTFLRQVHCIEPVTSTTFPPSEPNIGNLPYPPGRSGPQGVVGVSSHTSREVTPDRHVRARQKHWRIVTVYGAEGNGKRTLCWSRSNRAVR